MHDYSENYFEPPSSIPSLLYPQLGLYSCNDESTLRAHFQMMSDVGIDAAILQWWSFNSSEKDDGTQGFSDRVLRKMLNMSEEFGIKVGIEIQPYNGRNSTNIIKDIQGILENYAPHKSYLKLGGRPVIIIYEPYNVEKFRLNGSEFKEKPYLISTITNADDIGYNVEGYFDAMFTFFAAEFTTWSSNSSRWKSMCQDIHERGSAFIPGVAPGNSNEKIENWNRLVRQRKGTEYYDNMWRNAIDAKPDAVIINSFNGWLDATEIEPAISRPGYEFNKDRWSGEDGKPEDYLIATKKWIDQYKS